MGPGNSSTKVFSRSPRNLSLGERFQSLCNILKADDGTHFSYIYVCIEDLIRTNTVEAGQDNYSSACTAGDFERNMC